jgi:hypothetical protein
VVQIQSVQRDRIRSVLISNIDNNRFMIVPDDPNMHQEMVRNFMMILFFAEYDDEICVDAKRNDVW